MTSPDEFLPIELSHFPHIAESRTSALAIASYNATADLRTSLRTHSVRIMLLRAVHRSCACIVAACETASAFTPVLDRWAHHTARELQVAVTAMNAATGLAGDLVPAMTAAAEDLFTSLAELRCLVPAEAGPVHGAIDHLLEVDGSAASLAAMWNSGFAGRPLPKQPRFRHIADCFATSRDIVSSVGTGWRRHISATAAEALALIDIAGELMVREHQAARGLRPNDSR